MPTEPQIRNAEARLWLSGHKIERVGYRSGNYLLDGEHIDTNEMMSRSKCLS